jgi:N-acylglucosamine 2-epimerase/mannose-6-phosphate isomerase
LAKQNHNPDRAMLTIRFADVRSWLFNDALPNWASHGVDRSGGGFVEHLNLAGRDAGAAFKRSRAQSRQIYCFTHASLLGWEPGAEIAAHGWQFLMTNGRREDGAWVRAMGRGGGVLDATCDAYDMAFVLFAHAWWHRLTADPSVVESALATVEALDRLLKHPSGLGWLAHEGAAGAREQNPHMHIIEAAIELADSTGHPRFRVLASEVLALFHDRFLDRRTGLLPEFYAADWSRLDDAKGRVVEPGHMFEWAWILCRAKRLLGIESGDDARQLFDNAERLGLAPGTSLTFDQIDDRGEILAGGSRCWPQTEALKANLAVLEHYGADSRPRIARCVDNLLDRYLATSPIGTWIDQFDSSGQPAIDKIPSTTFYHLLLAFSELLRLQPLIESLGDDPPEPTARVSR